MLPIVAKSFSIGGGRRLLKQSELSRLDVLPLEVLPLPLDVLPLEVLPLPLEVLPVPLDVLPVPLDVLPVSLEALPFLACLAA